MDYDDSLILKTAWYYYVEDMTQQKISEHLGISRMRVVKLLEKARQDGVIQFKIREDSANRMQTERKLVKTYDLNDAYVIPASPDTETGTTNEMVAKAAAMYINDRLNGNSYINIGYGDTPSRILNNLATITERPISCVSLTGGVNYYLPDTRSNIFNAKLHLVPAPLLVSSQEMVEAMEREESVQEIFRMVGLAYFTVVGIGAMNDEATILRSGILKQNDFLFLKMQGAVGDLLSHFIDINGNLIHTNIENRLISTPLDKLKNLENVIGVAAGTNKIEAIRAALKSGCLNVLITDEITANKLIETEQSK